MTLPSISLSVIWGFITIAVSGGLGAMLFYWRFNHRYSASQITIATLRNDNKNLGEQLDRLQVEVETLREQNLKLNSYNSTLSVRLETEATRGQEQTALLEQTRASLGKEFENLANRIFDNKQSAFSRSSKEALNNTVDPLRKELADFRKKIEDVYDKESAERNRLVGKIGELQNQTLQIGQDAVKLANALKGDNKFQGNWGEIILERLLEESGLRKGREYQTQVTLQDVEGRRRNPDVVLHLPDKRDIVIDAKVSLKDYESFCRSDDEKQREQSLKAHIASLRGHVIGLNRKAYEQLEGINTLDFVLIFIPVEAAFMLAIEHDHDLFNEAYDRGIIIVSPSTLLATLRTIHNIWRYADQNLNAEKIAILAGGLYDQFVLMAQGLEDIGKHLDKSHEAWEITRKRLVSGRGNLVKRVDELKALGARSRRNMPVKLEEESQLSDSLLPVDAIEDD